MPEEAEDLGVGRCSGMQPPSLLLLLLCHSVVKTRGEAWGREVTGPIFLKRVLMGWGRRAKPHALRGHRVEENLTTITPQMQGEKTLLLQLHKPRLWGLCQGR